MPPVAGSTDPLAVPTVLPHRRLGRVGAVAAPSTDAALIGLEILTAGGNAHDAAVAVGAAAHITNTSAIGFGGDLAAVVHDGGTPGSTEALLACGPAPTGATPAAFRDVGHGDVPRFGIHAATVPAYLDGLLALARRGRMPLAEVLAPVVQLARRGAPSTDRYAYWSHQQADNFGHDTELARHHHVADGPPPPGLRRPMPALADWLAILGEDPAAARTALAEEVLALSRARDGFFSAADLEPDRARWSPAVTTELGQATVATTGHPTQGPVLALAVAIAQRCGIGHGDGPLDRHLAVEATRLAFGYWHGRLGDPEQHGRLGDPAGLPDGEMLPAEPDEAVVAELAARFDPDHASVPGVALSAGGTSTFTVADADGTVVAAIGSISLGFGAGVGVLGGDVLLACRLCRSAVLDPSVPHGVAPGRRPVTTIHAWVALADDETAAGATPGGDDQVLWNLQVLADRYGRDDPWGKALARPRAAIRPMQDRTGPEPGDVEVGVMVDGAGRGLAEALTARDHTVGIRRNLGGCMRVALVEHQADAPAVAAVSDGRHEGEALAR